MSENIKLFSYYQEGYILSSDITIFRASKMDSLRLERAAGLECMARADIELF